jgi:para-nitrobenzyl esterase
MTGLRVLLVTAALAVGLVGGGATASASDASRVRVSEGWLQGTVTADYRGFQGIPYAAPPVRWRAPRPPGSWQGVRDATQQGQPCAQLAADGSGVIGSEDCLFLNVMTPRAVTGPLPVLVFVHGGGLVNEHGAYYDPARIVEQGAVVVTLNYRLGALGFLRHSSLRDPYAGNFGLADQQAALRWVRHNIAAFGGDRRNVTLWGQSAGGGSASCGNAVLDEPTATSRGRSLAAEIGCADQTCLRDAPLEDLVRQVDQDQTFATLHRRSADKPWMPVAGTAAVPVQPLTALRDGTAADVPLIHGATRDEMRIHVAVTQAAMPISEYAGIVRQLYGQDADRVLAAYPASDYATPGLALATLMTDEGAQVGACSQLPALDAATRGAPVYAYEYAQPTDRPPISDFPLGAHHSADLVYFLDRGAPAPFTPEKKAFAERLIGHWVAFARTGSPQWPAYRRGTATVLSLSMDETGPVDLARGHRCGFWRSLGLWPATRPS